MILTWCNIYYWKLSLSLSLPLSFKADTFIRSISFLRLINKFNFTFYTNCNTNYIFYLNSMYSQIKLSSILRHRCQTDAQVVACCAREMRCPP